ncbi:MAG: glycosyltransferase, partial [Actinomycetota bacterium]|nr:glycosyltransferase [Actinomycetota bacterium]
VQEGVTGHVVRDPHSADAVAAVLTGLLDDPQRARRMGAAGRTWVEQRWSWTSIADTFEDLLQPGGHEA